MSSNTMTPVPILNRNSSDDEILGLTHASFAKYGADRKGRA